ncbi:hypothetical protein GCM10009555_017730 [Acrocarpospora macrocephala]|uniref:Uncharacterized protein n=1 Tax=Acrocarpospora macrocephala TaxID=150177 RepID=A0A5M3WK58_9ACTN|nr:hypothetical protein Amac_010280 [Acrocarpospora macrocephala]
MGNPAVTDLVALARALLHRHRWEPFTLTLPNRATATIRTCRCGKQRWESSNDWPEDLRIRLFVSAEGDGCSG